MRNGIHKCVQQFHLLIVGCLELEELGGIVDEGEDDDADDVTTSLAHVPLHSDKYLSENLFKIQNIKVQKYFTQRRI